MSARRELAVLVSVCLLSSLLVYLPFVLGMDKLCGMRFAETGPSVLVRYWDGPLYVVVSETFYAAHSEVYTHSAQAPEYYAAHLVCYPALIALFSFLGAFTAMLVVTNLAFVAAAVVFYFFVKELAPQGPALQLSLLFALVPPRWLIYHSVGATEPLFILWILLSLLSYRKGRYGAAGAFGALAAVTRITGVALYVALALHLLWKRRSDFTRLGVQARLALIPLALAAHFAVYQVRLGDFFAYFGVNSRLLKGPFSSVTVYGDQQSGEFVVLLAAIYLLGILRLRELGHDELFLFSLIHFVPFLFVAHNDLSRYWLPVFPFALLIGYSRLMGGRWVRWVLPVYVVGAYLYVWRVLPDNLMDQLSFERLAALVGG